MTLLSLEDGREHCTSQMMSLSTWIGWDMSGKWSYMVCPSWSRWQQELNDDPSSMEVKERQKWTVVSKNGRADINWVCFSFHFTKIMWDSYQRGGETDEPWFPSVMCQAWQRPKLTDLTGKETTSLFRFRYLGGNYHSRSQIPGSD